MVVWMTGVCDKWSWLVYGDPYFGNGEMYLFVSHCLPCSIRFGGKEKSQFAPVLPLWVCGSISSAEKNHYFRVPFFQDPTMSASKHHKYFFWAATCELRLFQPQAQVPIATTV